MAATACGEEMSSVGGSTCTAACKACPPLLVHILLFKKTHNRVSHTPHTVRIITTCHTQRHTSCCTRNRVLAWKTGKGSKKRAQSKLQAAPVR